MPDRPTVLLEINSADSIESDLEIHKHVDRQFVEQQAIVTQAAHALSASTDFYYTPRVLGYSVVDQVLCLEYLNDLIPLRDLLEEDRTAFWVLSLVARSLAFIHANLQIPAARRVPVPPGWMMGEQKPVPIHGDFNLINVSWQTTSDRLIILDWSPAPSLDFVATVGPRELDIALFLRSLFLQQNHLCRAIRRYSALRDAFLNEYQSSSPVGIDWGRLNRMICRLNRTLLLKQLRRGMVRSAAQSLIGQFRFERDRLQSNSFHPEDRS